MRYDLKSVYNPLQDHFKFTWDGEEYEIKAKDIALFPPFLAEHAAKHLANQILWNKKKEIDDPLRPKILEDIFSHTEWEIVDLTGKEKKEEDIKEEK